MLTDLPYTCLKQLQRECENELKRLARSGDQVMRLRLAESPTTPRHILSILARDPDWEVRLAVAQNPTIGRRALYKILRDASDDLRYALAEDPLLPARALKRLCEDENPYVASRASRTIERLMAPNPILVHLQF